MTALQELSLMKFKIDKAKYPTMPDYARPVTKYSDKTANGLTKCIIDWCLFNGHFAERTGNEGRMIDGRTVITDVLGRQRTIGSVKRIPSSGTKGTSDIKAVINGRMVAIEVKIGPDRQSDAQKEYQRKVESAGGVYIIARTFDEFIADMYRGKFNALK